jgi:hypothetical protein
MSSTSRRQRRRSGRPRQQQQSRRTPRRTTATPESVDYTREYAFIRRDLNRIVIWSALLFVGMFAVYFFL